MSRKTSNFVPWLTWCGMIPITLGFSTQEPETALTLGPLLFLTQLRGLHGARTYNGANCYVAILHNNAIYKQGNANTPANSERKCVVRCPYESTSPPSPLCPTESLNAQYAYRPFHPGCSAVMVANLGESHPSPYSHPTFLWSPSVHQ